MTQAEKTEQTQTQQQQQKEAVKKPSQPDDWRTQINWEKIYKYFSFFIIGLVPFFVKDMFLFREEALRLGHKVVSWHFLTNGIIATVIFTLVRKVFFMATHSVIFARILPQYQGETRVLHTKKVQKWLFDFVYYTFTSAYAYYRFSSAPWYPINFANNTEDGTRGVLTNWPGLPVNEDYYQYFEIFLTMQWGHHIWGVLDLIIVRRKIENRYYEWLVHHLLAFTLIFYSAYFNFQILAVSVLIIHDIGDIFLVMFKTCGEWKSTGFLFKYLVFQMIAGWFASRVYLYPKVVIWPVIVYKQTVYMGVEDYEIIAQGAYIYQTILLCCLYLMHLYWFAQMITLLASYIAKGLKEGRQKKDTGYGNEWDYHHYNPDKDLKKKQDSEYEVQEKLKHKKSE